MNVIMSVCNFMFVYMIGSQNYASIFSSFFGGKVNLFMHWGGQNLKFSGSSFQRRQGGGEM